MRKVLLDKLDQKFLEQFFKQKNINPEGKLAKRLTIFLNNYVTFNKKLNDENLPKVKPKENKLTKERSLPEGLRTKKTIFLTFVTGVLAAFNLTPYLNWEWAYFLIFVFIISMVAWKDTKKIRNDNNYEIVPWENDE